MAHVSPSHELIVIFTLLISYVNGVPGVITVPGYGTNTSDNTEGNDRPSEQTTTTLAPSPTAQDNLLGTCKEDGYMCTGGCKTLVLCIRNKNNFLAQSVRQCAGTINHYCNATSLSCEGASCEDAFLSQQTPSCYENGTFPDAWDCGSYYTCMRGNLLKHQCPMNYAYDAQYRNCTLSARVSRPCLEQPVPNCERLGPARAYPEDRRIFYVCSYNDKGYLVPQFRSCDEWDVFDEDRQHCVVPAGSSGLVASSVVVLLACVLSIVGYS